MLSGKALNPSILVSVGVIIRLPSDLKVWEIRYTSSRETITAGNVFITPANIYLTTLPPPTALMAKSALAHPHLPRATIHRSHQLQTTLLHDPPPIRKHRSRGRRSFTPPHPRKPRTFARHLLRRPPRARPPHGSRFPAFRGPWHQRRCLERDTQKWRLEEDEQEACSFRDRGAGRGE